MLDRKERSENDESLYGVKNTPPSGSDNVVLRTVVQGQIIQKKG